MGVNVVATKNDAKLVLVNALNIQFLLSVSTFILQLDARLIIIRQQLALRK